MNLIQTNMNFKTCKNNYVSSFLSEVVISLPGPEKLATCLQIRIGLIKNKAKLNSWRIILMDQKICTKSMPVGCP